MTSLDAQADHKNAHVVRLPGNIVNQIAAGEVIERPAAVVKELVENSLDSGADKISISITDGGIERIIVTDNGSGMSRDDITLAVQRHCTSKIHDKTLVHISTFGFRGEALPSIGSVARLHITSRQASDENGWTVQVDGGRVYPVEPAGAKKGTKVDVRSLFYATPARRKFLKSAKVESRHVENIIKKLALCAPQVAFHFENEGRIVLDLKQQTQKQRVESLIKVKEGDDMLTIDDERDGMRISGYAYPPSVNRANNNQQYMMVNARPVNDPILRIAIRVAYRGLIEAGRHPIVAIMLDIPEEELDVNVHPSKTEVRFAHEAKVRSFVISALRNVLSHGAGKVGIRPYIPKVHTSSNLTSRLPSEPSHDRKDATFKRPQPDLQLEQPPSLRDVQRKDIPQKPLQTSSEKQNWSQSSSLTSNFDLSSHQPSAHVQNHQEEQNYPLGAVIGQILDTYILSLTSDGSLIIIDQHAAHERVTHEQLRRQYLQGQLKEQRLLMPEVVDFTSAQKDRLLENQKELVKLGIDIEDFGHGAVLVRSLPALLNSHDAHGILSDVAQEMEKDEHGKPHEMQSLADRFDGIIARLACHGSIRAGRKMRKEEMEMLLRTMEKMPRTGTCSHGRPTWIKLRKEDIEKLFGRH